MQPSTPMTPGDNTSAELLSHDTLQLTEDSQSGGLSMLTEALNPRGLHCDGVRNVAMCGGVEGLATNDLGSSTAVEDRASPCAEAVLISPEGMESDEDFALITHWSVSGHLKVARKVADAIQQCMGWPHDKAEFACDIHEGSIQGKEPMWCYKGCCAGDGTKDGKCHCIVQ